MIVNLLNKKLLKALLFAGIAFVPAISNSTTVTSPLLTHTDTPEIEREFQNLYQSLQNVTSNLIPAGAIFEYAGATVPSGYLKCDGTAVSRTVYANLFTAISTTYGAGDGTTTFNVPNFNRRVPVGAGGSGTSTLGNALGNTGGEETHAQSIAEMPTHNHTITDPGHVHGTSTSNGGSLDGNVSFDTRDRINGPGLNTGNNTTGITINNAGSGTAFNVIQPSLIVNFIVKT